MNSESNKTINDDGFSLFNNIGDNNERIKLLLKNKI